MTSNVELVFKRGTQMTKEAVHLGHFVES